MSSRQARWERDRQLAMQQAGGLGYFDDLHADRIQRAYGAVRVSAPPSRPGSEARPAAQLEWARARMMVGDSLGIDGGCGCAGSGQGGQGGCGSADPEPGTMAESIDPPDFADALTEGGQMGRDDAWDPGVDLLGSPTVLTGQCAPPDFHTGVCLTQPASSRNCCYPVGPPYVPACNPYGYFYFQGNQLQEVPCSIMTSQRPYVSVGYVETEFGYGTGTVIALIGGSRAYVLTAAHVVRPSSDFDTQRVSFSLKMWGINCRPNGTVKVRRAWWPQYWEDHIAEPSMRARANDYAILECEWIPGMMKRAMLLTNTVLSPLWALNSPLTIGYACGLTSDGACREANVPYETPPGASYTGLHPVAGGGELITGTFEGTTGMSGGPLYLPSTTQGSERLIGIAVGSPCGEAGAGPETMTENWAAALSPRTHERIIAAVLDGRHDELHGPVSFDPAMGLERPVVCNPPCPS